MKLELLRAGSPVEEINVITYPAIEEGEAGSCVANIPSQFNQNVYGDDSELGNNVKTEDLTIECSLFSSANIEIYMPNGNRIDLNNGLISQLTFNDQERLNLTVSGFDKRVVRMTSTISRGSGALTYGAYEGSGVVVIEHP